MVFGDQMTSLQALVQRNSSAIEEFKIATAMRELSGPTLVEIADMGWKGPKMGWVKANWDVALLTKEGIMGCAVVICDHRGQLVVARCKAQKGCPTPLAAEGLATILAVKLCKDLALTNIHLEGDAKNLVEAVRCSEEDRSRDGPVLEDLKKEVWELYNWKMSFTRREGNKVAHTIARHVAQQSMN